MLVVAADVVQAANDKQQVAPILEQLGQLPEAVGTPDTLLADSGYFSAANVTACVQAEIAPLIAIGREHHHPSWRERFAEPAPAPDNPTPLEAMRHRLGNRRGQAALRPAQADPRAGVRHRQGGDAVPAILVARSRQGQGRVEPRRNGLEHQADVRSRWRLTTHTLGEPSATQGCQTCDTLLPSLRLSTGRPQSDRLLGANA